MLALQASVVAMPRPMARVGWMSRFRSRAWALIPIASIVGVVFAIRYASSTATGLTYLALVAVPLLAAAALGWAMRGAKPAAALGAPALFAVAWLARGSLSGEAAGAILSALSCVTLGVLLAVVTPPGWLKVGILLMSAADVWLVLTDLLQHPNSVLVAAIPVVGGVHLPQLQSEAFGSVSMGYGYLFVAGLLGAALSTSWRRQRRAAVLTLLLAGLFDLLFFVLNELPATVPVALALVVEEIYFRVRERRVSAGRRPSRPVGATPRQAK
jgi:hypothetical protein